LQKSRVLDFYFRYMRYNRIIGSFLQKFEIKRVFLQEAQFNNFYRKEVLYSFSPEHLAKIKIEKVFCKKPMIKSFNDSEAEKYLIK